MERVVLVDEHDNAIGSMEKMQAHQMGTLHRAFSIFIFNTNGEMLLQQRALTKYHCCGLWTNTCCSHPRPDEAVEDAAHRRLMEEMGLACALTHVGAFTYRVAFENGLLEHEYDHLFIGTTDSLPNPNPDEVHATRWVSLEELEGDIESSPKRYTYWFRMALPKIRQCVQA